MLCTSRGEMSTASSHLQQGRREDVGKGGEVVRQQVQQELWRLLSKHASDLLHTCNASDKLFTSLQALNLVMYCSIARMHRCQQLQTGTWVCVGASGKCYGERSWVGTGEGVGCIRGNPHRVQPQVPNPLPVVDQAVLRLRQSAKHFIWKAYLEWGFGCSTPWTGASSTSAGAAHRAAALPAVCSQCGQAQDAACARWASLAGRRWPQLDKHVLHRHARLCVGSLKPFGCCKREMASHCSVLSQSNGCFSTCIWRCSPAACCCTAGASASAVSTSLLSAGSSRPAGGRERYHTTGAAFTFPCKTIQQQTNRST